MTDLVPLLLRDQRHSLLKASLPMGAAPAMRRNAPPPEEEAMVFEMSHEHCGYDCETSPPSAAAARHEVGRGGFSLHAVEPSPVEWWAALGGVKDMKILIGGQLYFNNYFHSSHFQLPALYWAD